MNKAEGSACSHLCPSCGQRWHHEGHIPEVICRLKPIATCRPCLKEVARVLCPIHNRMDAPLEETLWERPEI